MLYYSFEIKIIEMHYPWNIKIGVVNHDYIGSLNWNMESMEIGEQQRHGVYLVIG